MQDKKRLRRRCKSCKNIFDVSRDTAIDGYNGFRDSGTVRIRWTKDSFNCDVRDDHTLLWICDYCQYESAMEI